MPSCAHVACVAAASAQRPRRLTRETQQKINAEASARTEADSLEQEARESLKKILCDEMT